MEGRFTSWNPPTLAGTLESVKLIVLIFIVLVVVGDNTAAAAAAAAAAATFICGVHCC